MDRRSILLGGVGLALGAGSSASGQQATQKRFALILANQIYEKNPLPNIDNDAALMGRTLKSLGFAVTTLMNGTRSTMRTKLKELKDNLTANPGAIGFVYYSGHGVQVDGENYLVPVNNGSLTSEADVKEDCLSLSYVLEMSKGTQVKAYITVLDACRDNPFLGQKGDGSKGLAVVGRKVDETTLVAFAASPGETASATLGGANSIYTAELVKQLQIPNLSLQEVFRGTRSAIRITTSSQQYPREDFSNPALLELRLSDGFEQRGNLIAIQPNAVTQVASSGSNGFATKVRQIRGTYPRLAEYLNGLRTIPAGDLLMGSIRYQLEAPVHKVELSAFAMGARPVTVALWKEYAVAKLGGQMPPEPSIVSPEGTTKFNIGWKDLDHPVVNVTWDDCRSFSLWATEIVGVALGLPSEAQWEYACRGATPKYDFPWSYTWVADNVWCSDVTLGDCGGTGSVNRSKRIWNDHSWGLIDMVGNVCEWCMDYYDTEWYGRPEATGRDIVNLKSSPVQKLQQADGNSTESSQRCTRGGSWYGYYPSSYRCASRDGRPPISAFPDVGFRLVAKSD